MSNNSNEQEERQQQQQQQQPQIPFSMNFYSQQSYQQPPQYVNPYYGANTFNEQSDYYQPPQQQYHQPQQLFNPYQPSMPPQIQQQQQQQQQQYTPTLQQFNDPVVPTEPDEFITDLLKKPQERLFLLKIELELEALIKDENKLRLDFPNMNSYQRLMIHRLAPYYKLNHYHDAMRKGVYVCKTFITELPSVRLPDVPLDANSDTKTDDNTESTTPTSTGNSTPQFKIMRRAPGSNSSSPRSTHNSEEQAKADRKNMTYAERKTAYEEARARIFQS